MDEIRGDIRPRLAGHVYWHEKKAFQLKEDTNEYWVLFAVEDGSFSFGIDDREGIASFGDLVLCPPGIAFRRETISPLSFHMILLTWTDQDGRPVPFPEAPYGKLAVRDIDRLSSTYAYLKKWADGGGNSARQLKNHLLADLWYMCVEEAEAAERLPPPNETESKDPLMHRAALIMEREMSAPFSLKALAAELGLTPVQFTRRFTKAVGVLPIDYVTSLRLRKVQKLLLDGDLSLKQIAALCGFENEFYLSRVFKKKKKMAPSQFRKLHRL